MFSTDECWFPRTTVVLLRDYPLSSVRPCRGWDTDGIRRDSAGIRPGFGRDSAEMVESQIIVVVAPVNVVVMEIRDRDEDQIVVVMGIES